MYMLDGMIDMTQVDWKTNFHRELAIEVLICNPRITNLDTLKHFAAKINEIDNPITATLGDLMELGVPLN